jgi:hypothetical protein
VTDAVPFDRTKLLSEIQSEVVRRRVSGELPMDLERELDRTFAEFAPVDAIDADFDTIVSKVERSAVIDLRPSVVSAYPGAAQMKLLVAKATAFFVRHVATQVSALVQGLARALRMLGDRVDQVERALGGRELAALRVQEGLRGTESCPTATDTWDEFIIEQLGPAGSSSGRVLQANAANGRLVRRLVDAGYDAYGVEPSEEAALVAADRVPDVRATSAADHLRTLPPASLGALILSGVVDQLDPIGLMDLVELAASRLEPGGTMIVVSCHPDEWQRNGPPLAVDLAPGRPVHPETWRVLLGRAGLVERTTQLGRGRQLPAIAGDGSPQWAVGNENFARLAEAVFGPADFAISARRPR